MVIARRILRLQRNRGLRIGQNIRGSFTVVENNRHPLLYQCLPPGIQGISREHHNIPAIPVRELKQAFFVSALPMLGFGFMDNTILIFAGEYIDVTFGAALGIHTLTAAACGQVFSDAAGVMFRTTIESISGRAGVRPPKVCLKQRTLRCFRYTTTLGALIGVITGCLLGMCHLLWYETDVRNRKKKEVQLNGILEGVMTSGPGLFDCEIATLFLLEPKDSLLYTKHATNDAWIEVPLTQKSIVTDVFFNHEQIRVDPTPEQLKQVYIPDVAKKNELVVRSMLAHPVFMQGRCVGVIEVINKNGNKLFDEEDEKMLRVLCEHTGFFMSLFQFRFDALED